MNFNNNTNANSSSVYRDLSNCDVHSHFYDSKRSPVPTWTGFVRITLYWSSPQWMKDFLCWRKYKRRLFHSSFSEYVYFPFSSAAREMNSNKNISRERESDQNSGDFFSQIYKEVFTIQIVSAKWILIRTYSFLQKVAVWADHILDFCLRNVAFYISFMAVIHFYFIMFHWFRPN